LFSQSQILKAKKFIKKGEVQLNFLIKGKAYFKIKSYEVIIDLKNKRATCTCNYFIFKRGYCSHILASVFYLFKEVNSIYQFFKKKR